MKRAFRYIFIFFVAAAAISFSPTYYEKKFHFEFSESQLNALWNCIDNSSASHDQVKAVEAIIQAQLKPQLDSVPKPKPK